MEDRINDLRKRLQESSQRITTGLYEVRKLSQVFYKSQQRLEAEQEHFHRLDRELAEIDGRTKVLPPSKPRPVRNTKVEAEKTVDQQLASMKSWEVEALISKLMACKSFKE